MKYIKYFLLLFIWSCSSRYMNIGWELFYNKNFEGSKNYFSKTIKNDSSNYDAIKGLGLSYLMLNDYEHAEFYLKKAFDSRSNDLESIFSLALYYSIKEEHQKAINLFEKFISLTDKEDLKIVANQLLLHQKKLFYNKELKDIIEIENKLTELPLEENSIAVLPFKNYGEQGDYNVLEKGLADQTITYLGYIKNLKVLERIKIDELYKEIKLSQSEIIDKSTAIRAGKLLKAEKLLTGNFKIENDNLNLKMFFVNVKNGKISDEIVKDGKLDNFFDIHKESLLETLDKMNISINDETRKKIITYRTESILEFISYLKKKYLEESESIIISEWMINRIDNIKNTPIENIINLSQSSSLQNIKSTILPMEIPNLETPPTPPRWFILVQIQIHK